MAHVLSKSAMQRVTPAELEDLAGRYRENIQAAAEYVGRETKVYLHWSAGHYGQFWDDYHVQIDKDGEIYVIGDGELDDVLEATYRRNSGSVSICILGCLDANPNNLGQESPTPLQIDGMAQAIAALVNSAPGALDTLQELARALGNDANFATTVTNALAGKLGKTEKAASAGNSDTLEGQSLQWILNQINAAKTGIIAGNLAQNGWVKFANGLIVQWGSIRNYEYNMFPVAYTQWVHVFLVAGISGKTPEDRSTTYGATLVGDPTLTKFYPLVGNTEYEGGVPDKTGVGRWMSIGV